MWALDCRVAGAPRNDGGVVMTGGVAMTAGDWDWGVGLAFIGD
jgi:hypothetical protein